MRCPVSPTARASLVCMSMQYAQPLSCDARLRDRAPHVRVRGLAAGMHAVLELPAGYDEDDTVARAAQRGLALQGLRSFGPREPDGAPALVIGYGTPPAHAFTTAIARLA